MKITERATIRRYTDREVSDELLRRLLADAEHTQTMGNLQLYSVVITRDNAMKQRIAPAHFSQPMVTEAPVVLTFCADYHRTTRWAEERKAHPGYDNFLSFLNGAQDALLYCQSFCQLAEDAGLGLCYLGTTVYNPMTIIETLQLPRLVMPLATITLGWPAEQPTPSDRLPLDAIVHEETYHQYVASDIDTYYIYKESLAENKAFVEQNHTETLAQIFTDIRYTKKDCEAISLTFLDALKHQGFL